MIGLLFVFAIYWAMNGAQKQARTDARAGWDGVRDRINGWAGKRLVAARAHPHRRVRWSAAAAVGAGRTVRYGWHGTAATARGARRAGGSLATGWRDGWQVGKDKHAAYEARKAERRTARAVTADRPFGAARFPTADPADEDRTDSPVAVPARDRSDDAGDTADRDGWWPQRNWTMAFRWAAPPWEQHKDPVKYPGAIAVWDEADLERRRQEAYDGVRRGDLLGFDVVEEPPVMRPPGYTPTDAWELDAMHHAPDEDSDDTAPVGAAHTETEGTTMTAPTGEASTYELTQAAFKQIANLGAEFTSSIDNIQAGLSDNDLDPQTLGDVAALMDAAENVKNLAERALHGLEQRHSHIAEAIQTASVDPAKTTWYKG